MRCSCARCTSDAVRVRGMHHLCTIQSTRLTTRLITSETIKPEVSGTKRVKFSLSMRMSPGRWPSPSLASSGQAKPRTTSAAPRMMRKRAMDATRVRLIVARLAGGGGPAVCSCASARHASSAPLPARPCPHGRCGNRCDRSRVFLAGRLCRPRVVCAMAFARARRRRPYPGQRLRPDRARRGIRHRHRVRAALGRACAARCVLSADAAARACAGRPCGNARVRRSLDDHRAVVQRRDDAAFGQGAREVSRDLVSRLLAVQGPPDRVHGFAAAAGDRAHCARPCRADRSAARPSSHRSFLSGAAMSVLVPSLGLIMFAAVFLVLPLGFPVGFTLMGTALFFSLIGHLLGAFDLPLLTALPQRLIGLMENDLLQAIPLFVYLGVIMQRTTLAQELLEAMSGLFGSHAGGLSISTVILGALLAPTTGAVGASVLTLGLLALPAMLSAGYKKSLASGVVCSAGTLGTVLPPSIILIVLADLMRGANAEAQIMRGEDVHGALIIKDIYVGMLAPVGILLALYLVYVVATALLRPADCPPLPPERRTRLPWARLFVVVFGPLAFIVLLLGSIVTGRVYTVEAASLGAIVATVYAWVRGELNWLRWAETVRMVMRLTGMMFLLLVGASTF